MGLPSCHPMPRVKTDGAMLLHRRLTMKLPLRLVSPAAMLAAVLSAAPAANTTPIIVERLSAADANVFFGYYLQEHRGRELVPSPHCRSL